MERTCACGRSFTTTKNAKSCSPECARERRLAWHREYAAAKHVPAAPLPLKPCDECGNEFIPYRANTRFCSRRCQWNCHTKEKVRRVVGDFRPCHKCGTAVAWRAGKPVCEDCKVNPRANSAEKERRRRLRSYGLTEHGYAAMVAAQQGRCAICGTTDPVVVRRNGRHVRDWAIDHCHDTGQVRGLLCQACNLAIGQMGDDPRRLRSAADYIETHRARQLRVV